MGDTVSLRELISGEAHGTPLLVVDLDGADWSLAGSAARSLDRHLGVAVGLSAEVLPAEAAPLLEALTVTLARGGPGRSWAGSADDLEAVRGTVAAAPHASATMASLLAVTARSSVPDGLVAESMAYSMLLGSREFAEWRAATPRRHVQSTADPVLVERVDDVLTVTLNRPERHNAFGAAVRDGLIEALVVAELDESVSGVCIRGNGPSFCGGGDLDEFGTAADLAAAHLLRVRQSAAHAVHRLADRVVVQVHGACIGAGIEVPSFAQRVEAAKGSWFQLPELSMGLVPGAGGTVGITHRIGRWRTAYLALTGRPLDLETALGWGLVDAVV